MLGVNQEYQKQMYKRRIPSVMSWAVSFENVLLDPVGLNTFKEFLEREFSAENIKFWIVCEHYRNQFDKIQRKKLAKDIIDYHLCHGAPEAINIDSHTRQKAIERMHDAPLDLFVSAQKQIFNLMKFDCYQRFLKSDLFTGSLTAEKLGKPLPFQERVGSKSPKKPRSRSKSHDRCRLLQSAKLNLNLPQQNKSANDRKDNLKNSNEVSPATSEQNSPKDESDEKKRKSLLPWQKGRAKSTEPGRAHSQSPVLRQRGSNFRRSKRKAADKKRCTDSDTSNLRSSNNTLEVPDSPSRRNSADEKHGRYLLPPSADEQYLKKDCGQKTEMENTIQKILRKNGFEPNKLINDLTKEVESIQSSLSNFCDREIMTKQCIIIRLELPSKKVIAVRAKPDKSCYDILKPVLKKYGVDISNVNLYFDDSDTQINPSKEIRIVDRRKICARLKEPKKITDTSKSVRKTSEKYKKGRKDVTSHILEEIVKGKICFYYDELGILDLENSEVTNINECSQLDECNLSSDVPRRNSFTVCKDADISTRRSLYSNRASIHEGMGIKIQLSEMKIPQEHSNTTPRRSSAKNVHYRDSCDLTRVWKRAQKQMDDQRGLELNCELPDFLRVRSDSSPAELSNIAQ